MRNSAVHICINKDTDQLCSNCTADQRHCFHFMVSTIFLLLQSRISSSVTVLADLCYTWSETKKTSFLVSSSNRYFFFFKFLYVILSMFYKQGFET